MPKLLPLVQHIQCENMKETLLPLFVFSFFLSSSAEGLGTTCSSVQCSSWKFRPSLCRVHSVPWSIRNIVVELQQSRSPCILWKSYGFDRFKKTIWVKRGCRAIFRVCYKDRTSVSTKVCKAVTCSSRRNRRVQCRIDDAPGKIVSVMVAEQKSKSPCKSGKSYGFNKRKTIVWVKAGCRATFQVCFRFKNLVCEQPCGPNAECVSGKCLCKKGNVGNPYTGCEEACTCSVSGDPHYRCFDKQLIHFQGICMYTLVKVTDPNDPCYFNVEVKNERRGSNSKVSFTRLVDIEIYGVKIRFHQKRVVYVNGMKKYLPVVLFLGKLKIIMVGDFVRLITRCGISVSWNGRTQVFVQIPKSYGSRVTGICGNCNGKQDDFRTKDDIDVSNMPTKYKMIGESYAVTDISDKPHFSCKTEEIDDDVCTEEMEKYIDESQYCGFLNAKYAYRSPFKVALTLYKNLADDMYDSCRYDVCSYFNDKKRVKEAVCNILETFATDMEARGINNIWRKPEFCDLKCPENMEYSYKVSGCPPTCLDLNPDPKECHVPPIEGCQCKEGYVHSDNGCVPRSQCGCSCFNGYLPLNYNMTSADCTKTIHCLLQNGRPVLVTKDSNVKCHANAKCGLLNGAPHCVCKDGYFGNGITSCYPYCKGKKCAMNARCESGRCVCEPNYHGNGYVKCEPEGICGGKSCAPNAECNNYMCICKEDYFGDGYENCTEMCGGKTCAANAECEDRICKCEIGYHGNGYFKCEPLAVCNGQTCAENAECLNFQCVCKLGYSGVGTERCEKLCDGRRCVANAKCNAEEECECDPGFHGNPYYRCERIGICDDRSCVPDAECVNYKCLCKQGFYGDGYKGCQPLCDGKKCAAKARCVENKTCECLPGFHGNGFIKCESDHICGGKRCVPNAVCINYQCHCIDEYFGDGYVKCKPLCNGRRCTESAYCFEGQCMCANGYHGNAYILCEPETLCGNKTCAVNGKCVNYQCVCKDNFVGDGYDQCEELCDGKPCTEFANCQDGVCKCIEGYHGNGLVKCEPVHICGSRTCAKNAECKNYNCICKSNYYGDGYKKCHPLCYGKKCGQFAECVNGQCECKEGYHGNPFINCEPISQCGGRQCVANATCKNYHCQCDEGYTGSGYKKCDELCDGKVCKYNSYCKEGQCICKAGYHGDGAIKCEPIGECGGRKCVAYGHCYNYKCVCDEGYSGNAYEKCHRLCDYRRCANFARCDNSTSSCVCLEGYHGNPYINCEPKKYCNGEECAPYATCINYQCICQQGYIGDGKTSCEKLCNNMKCGENAECMEDRQCKCIPNFHGNPHIKCEPDGMCGGKVCSEYARCNNYICQCLNGYYGDPYDTCKPLCGKSKCVEFATCEDEECVCLPGFHGDGYVKCEGKDVCNGKPCANNSECINYHCVCKKGYFGDGATNCQPYCGGKKCSANAFCKNRKCHCDAGYHGDPYVKCEPYGYCDGVKCADYADCENYKCFCRKGYLGNGYEECKPLCNGRKCALFAKCIDGECKCIPQYHGNGYVKCELDTVCGGKTCGENAKCVNFQCVCPYGHYGDGYKECIALCNGKKCAPNAVCLDGECVCETGFHGDALIKCEPKGFCGGKVCADFTRCHNYQCQCMEGYIGNPMERCEELCNGTKCPDFAYCKDKRTCECMANYHGDGHIKCEPIGVCGGKQCGTNAVCKGYHCLCPEGYFGDGYSGCGKLCNGKKCGKYAECTSDGCQCQPGYHGNPFWKCEETQMCGGNQCHQNALCQHYVCRCKDGYFGDGILKCEETCNGRLCTANSECKNGECVCKKGFHGFGAWKCEPDGICGGQQCQPNAKCINFMCICKQGYFGDGYISCKAFCGGGVCAENSKCSKDRCECEEGYRGDAYLKCEPAGMCGGRECAKYAVCEKYTCTCRQGYSGDGYEKCELEGLCKEKKCTENAECLNGRCVCKAGFHGNGYRLCDRKCVCSASGDPHYLRYDGRKLNFQGACKYTLTKLTRVVNNCMFNVEVKNARRGKNKKVSWTKIVDVEIGDETIRFMHRKKVYINKYRKYLPINDKEGAYKIYRSGQWVILQTKCDLEVYWNGRSGVMVKVPVNYGPYVTGLCGNCNGLDDDDRTKDNIDVSRFPRQKRWVMIGDSFKVTDDTVDPNEVSEECKTNEVPPPDCTAEHIEAAKVPSICGLLDFQNKNSPFRKCIKQYPLLADVKYKDCIYDACETFGDPAVDAETTGCGYYEEFAEECSLRGLQVQWRSQSICPLACGPNMRYSSNVSGCPSTCIDPNPDCHLPSSEGCECLSGYVLSDDKCVKKQDCGCRNGTHNYIPIGSQYVLEDCSEIQECELIGGVPKMTAIKINLKCCENSVCAVKDGIPTCICLPGYHGDGYTQCIPNK